MNKKSFNIYINKSKSFNIIPFSLKKSFNIYLRNSQNFVLRVNNIKPSVPGYFEYLAKFTSKMAITSISRLKIKNTVNIGEKFNLTFNLRSRGQFNHSYITKSLLRIVARVKFRNSQSFANNSKLSITSRERDKESSNIFSSGIGLTITTILKGFFLLSDYDPNALSVMDSQTLDALDYYII